MDWKDVAGKVAELAPTAGAVLGGPLGAGVGVAIKALAGVFGIRTASPQPQEVLQAIQADPNAVLKLETARAEYEKAKLQTDLDTTRAMLDFEQKERSSARAREIEITKAKGSDWDKRFLTILGIVGPQALLWWIVIDGFPTLSQELTLLVGNIMGIMWAKYSTIFDYHMGTSSASIAKNDTIAALAKNGGTK